MIVVLRPFKHVEHFKPQTLGTSAFDQVLPSPEEKFGFMHTQTPNQFKKLYIGEIDPKMLIRGDPTQQLMLIKEQTRTRSKIFHICDAYDIASIKAQREQEEALGGGFDRKSAISA